MAKCSICNSRKGKRTCLLSTGLICSQCCGSTRSKEKCAGCSYYQEPQRSYAQVPAYSVQEMADSFSLVSFSDIVEGCLCAFDEQQNSQLKDRDCQAIVEKLLDYFYFSEQQPTFTNDVIAAGFTYTKEKIEPQIGEDLSKEGWIKIINTVRHSIKRRTDNDRSYLAFIHSYVGASAASGVKMIKNIAEIGSF